MLLSFVLFHIITSYRPLHKEGDDSFNPHTVRTNKEDIGMESVTSIDSKNKPFLFTAHRKYLKGKTIKRIKARYASLL